jgi:hypothetical protein
VAEGEERRLAEGEERSVAEGDCFEVKNLSLWRLATYDISSREKKA